MRVLQIGKYYPPYMGGIETHLRALCSGLAREMEVEVLVASNNAREVKERIEGILVTRVATPLHLASAPICPALAARIRASNPELVHVHLPNPAAVLAYLASGHSGPLIVTYHSDTVKQKFLGLLFEPLLHRFLNRASIIIATSPNYLDSSPVLLRHRNRCKVIPYGITVEEFSRTPEPDVSLIRRRFGQRLVIAVGRMVYYKGFEYLVKAMPDVRGHLLLVGDGPLTTSLMDLATSLGVAERVTFLGNLPNEAVIPYYHAADIFVLPSIARSEAFGIVQIEAMAAGKAVVNTDLDSGVPYVSQHGITGITVKPKNSAALAEAINLLLDNGDLRYAYGSAALARVRSEFGLDRMIVQIREIYTEVFSGSCALAVAAR